MTEQTPASESLTHSRARIAQWLTQDQLHLGESPLGETVRNTLPFLNAVWSHPATAMMLGAVSKSWCRSDADAPTPDDESAPLNFAVDQVKQHPKTVLLGLGVVGVAAAYWLSRQGRTGRKT
jgi:hypothetical protein